VAERLSAFLEGLCCMGLIRGDGGMRYCLLRIRDTERMFNVAEIGR
jgi:hypothetical protein